MKLGFIAFVIENIIGYDEELLRPILKEIKLNPQGIEDANQYADELRSDKSLSGVECEFMAQLGVLLKAGGVDWEKTDFESILKQINGIILARKRIIPWPFDNTLNSILEEMKPDASKKATPNDKETLNDKEMMQLLQKSPYQGVYQYDMWTLGPFGPIESRSPRYFIPRPLCSEDAKDAIDTLHGAKLNLYWEDYKFYGCPSPGHCSNIKKVKAISLRRTGGWRVLWPEEHKDIDTIVDRIGCYPYMISLMGHVFERRDNLAMILFKVFKQNESFYREKFFAEKTRFHKVIANNDFKENFKKCSKPELLQLLCLVGNEDIVRAIDTMIYEERPFAHGFVIVSQDVFTCEREVGKTFVYSSEVETTFVYSKPTYQLGIGPYGMTKVYARNNMPCPPQLLLTHLIIKAFKSAGQEEGLNALVGKKIGTLEERVLCWMLEKDGGEQDVLNATLGQRPEVLKKVLSILKMPDSILDSIDFANKENTDKPLNWILNKVGLYPPPKIDDGLNNYERLISETLKYVNDKGLKELNDELRGRLNRIFSSSEKILKDTIIFNSYMFLDLAWNLLGEFTIYPAGVEFIDWRRTIPTLFQPIGRLLDIPVEEAVMSIKEIFDGQPIEGGNLKIDEDVGKWDLGTAYHIIELFPKIIKMPPDETLLCVLDDGTYEGFSSEQEEAFRNFKKQLQQTKLRDIRNSLSHHNRQAPTLEEILEMLGKLQELARFMHESNLYPRLAHYKGAHIDAHGFTRLLFEDEYEKPFKVFMRIGNDSLFNPFEEYGFKIFTKTEPIIDPIIIKRQPIINL